MTEDATSATDILILLAKRLNPNRSYWHSRLNLITDTLSVNCFLCGQEIEYGDLGENIQAHGIQHLKEFNLLSFI